MTPIYGRSHWHDPRANVVPPRAAPPLLWHGRHDPPQVVVPPFEVILLCKNAGWHDGTTARLFANKTGDVGKSDESTKYIHLTALYAKVSCRRATPKHPQPYMGVSGG